jgi:hypothetical protein
LAYEQECGVLAGKIGLAKAPGLYHKAAGGAYANAQFELVKAFERGYLATEIDMKIAL